MPTITKKQFEDYNRLCIDRIYGRILTPDGLRLICEANNYDPEDIGKQMLETYTKMQVEGAYEGVFVHKLSDMTGGYAIPEHDEQG